MFRPRRASPLPRPGVILLVVITLLTLFAVVGLAFVLYAQSEANAARLAREAETLTRPDADPEQLLGYFLGPCAVTALPG
jgi:CHASE1-domain containing sensor protein